MGVGNRAASAHRVFLLAYVVASAMEVKKFSLLFTYCDTAGFGLCHCYNAVTVMILTAMLMIDSNIIPRYTIYTTFSHSTSGTLRCM